mgnify:CR=1 FL=1|tara:strand:+ start:3783 stop:4385 length:603 start_codon:yes stop_codon:yes gene_type:complete
MSFRIENKYEVSIKKIDNLYNFFKYNNVEQIYDKRQINSIYFDNNYKDSFCDSEEGTVPRKKIRLRYYGSSDYSNKDELFLEKKINSYDGKYKTSKKINDYEKLIKFGVYDNFYGNCTPIVVVNYLREYYKLGKFRITFDRNIKYNVFGKKIFFKDLEQCILEVKSNDIYLENEIDNLFPFKKIRYSKYANSIKSLKLNI